MYTEHCHEFGGAIKFDPEGLVSTLSATCSVLIGYLSYKYQIAKQNGGCLIKLGIILIVLGLLFSLIVPINKKLWTSSYVLVTSGYGLLLYWIISNLSKNSLFLHWLSALSMNAIAIYWLHVIWRKSLFNLPSPIPGTSLYEWLYKTVFVPFVGHLAGSLLFTVIQLGLFSAVALLLYNKRLFIRI